MGRLKRLVEVGETASSSICVAPHPPERSLTPSMCGPARADLADSDAESSRSDGAPVTARRHGMRQGVMQSAPRSSTCSHIGAELANSDAESAGSGVASVASRRHAMSRQRIARSAATSSRRGCVGAEFADSDAELSECNGKRPSSLLGGSVDDEQEVAAWLRDLIDRAERLREAFSRLPCLPTEIRRFTSSNSLAGKPVFDMDRRVNLPLLLGAHRLLSQKPATARDEQERHLDWLARKALELGLVTEGEVRRGRLSNRGPAMNAIRGARTAAKSNRRPERASLDAWSDEEHQQQPLPMLFGMVQPIFPKGQPSGGGGTEEEDELERIVRLRRKALELRAKAGERWAHIKAKSSDGIDIDTMRSVLTAPTLSCDWETKQDEDEPHLLEVELPEDSSQLRREMFMATIERAKSRRWAEGLKTSGSDKFEKETTSSRLENTYVAGTDAVVDAPPSSAEASTPCDHVQPELEEAVSLLEEQPTPPTAVAEATEPMELAAETSHATALEDSGLPERQVVVRGCKRRRVVLDEDGLSVPSVEASTQKEVLSSSVAPLLSSIAVTTLGKDSQSLQEVARPDAPQGSTRVSSDSAVIKKQMRQTDLREILKRTPVRWRPHRLLGRLGRRRIEASVPTTANLLHATLAQDVLPGELLDASPQSPRACSDTARDSVADVKSGEDEEDEEEGDVLSEEEEEEEALMDESSLSSEAEAGPPHMRRRVHIERKDPDARRLRCMRIRELREKVRKRQRQLRFEVDDIVELRSRGEFAKAELMLGTSTMSPEECQRFMNIIGTSRGENFAATSRSGGGGPTKVRCLMGSNEVDEAVDADLIYSGIPHRPKCATALGGGRVGSLCVPRARGPIVTKAIARSAGQISSLCAPRSSGLIVTKSMARSALAF